MKVSYNWLKSYLNFNLSPEELSEILTDTGLEVEKLEKFDTIQGGLEGVIVGEVVDCCQHPGADKLKVTKVDIAAGDDLQIVCGAPNVAKGQKVLVATVGTTLMPEPNKPFKIKKAKIRGEASFGMICAEDELGIGESHDGIMVLPEDTPVGISAAEYLNHETDYVFEIGLTPNRTDAFGHFGVARDIAARLSLKEKTRAVLPELDWKEVDRKGEINVEIKDEKGCGRYAGVEIHNVKIAPSPEWLQNRLRAIGLAPINNVVDITNFVLHETGQPLHAFDADKITGKKVVVNTLPTGTKFTTLDDVERELNDADLMICNAESPMCIAGVFGGIESGVTENTSKVFLESAWFNPVRVRKTAKRHGLNTDASFRFERGVDPSETIYALKRAALLIQELGEGEIAGSVIDEITEIPEVVKLNFNIERLSTLTGLNISEEKIKEILDSLDIKVLSEGNGIFELEIPTYRVDVTREADVVEEILRIYGYNEVEIPERMSISVSIDKKPEKSEVINNLGNLLVGMGYSEMMSNGLTRSDYILKVAGEDAKDGLVAMLNPLSMELDVLRPNILVSAMESVSYNLNRQADRLKLYEIGKSYSKEDGTYKEHNSISLVITGNRFIENWNNPVSDSNISDLKSDLRKAFDFLGFNIDFDPSFDKDPFYDAGVNVLLHNKPVGKAGYVSKKTLKTYGIKKPVLVAECNLDTLLKKMKHAGINLDTLPKFPSVRRDLSLLIDKKVGFAEIEAIAYKKAGKLVREVGLFDVYEGKNLPEGKKSYAVSFVLQDKNKTLEDKQIDKVMNGIQKELETALGATLR